MTDLPLQYTEMPDDEVYAAIRQARQTLGDRLTILGHHYQRDEVIQFADFRGDSLELSRQAARATKAEHIVFCGVHFMAETAAILCQPTQKVIQPVIEALCPMASMADAEETSTAWNALSTLWGGDLLPLTYQNSVAELKAFVGKQGGAVCTSSNAAQLFRWAFSQKGHVLFLPDEHLGTNTALAMGIPHARIGVWNPLRPPAVESLAGCQVVVWKGFCSVHTRFKPEDVDEARAKHPDALIVVHPECRHEVVAKADIAGSTTAIIRAVEEAPAGSTVIIGTELHLVNRLAEEYPDKQVLPLRRSECRTMAMTTARHLLYALDAIQSGTPHNIVTVDEDTATWAHVALERMLRGS